MPTKQIAEIFCVSPAWARRVNQRRRDLGETTPRKMGGPGKCKIDRHKLAELVQAQPDATLKELRAHLGIKCSESAIWKALDKMNLSFKKRRSMPPSKTVPMSPSVASRGNSRNQPTKPGV